MQNLIFSTPGHIDIRAFTIFGVNAKPNTTSPIGYFGTGLKYAIAALCRLKSFPIIYIGKDKYTFYTKSQSFRNIELQTIHMKREKWSFTKPTYHEMPFTTELGKNWKPWQIFRELEANTRDENGETYTLGLSGNNEVEEYREINRTKIIIDNEEVLSAYHDRNSIFLPSNLSPKSHSSELEVFNQPSKFLFYRGLRVAELEKPTLYTYNSLVYQILTEDRTLAYIFSYRNTIAKYVAQSQDEKLIKSILSAPSTIWEHELDFDSIYTAPNSFISAIFAEEKAKNQRHFSTAAYRWHDAYIHEEPEIPSLLDRFPLPWRVEDEIILDAIGNKILSTYNDVGQTDITDFLTLITETMNHHA